MNERASPAYFISVFLHGAAIAIIILLAYLSSLSRPETPQIFELVAGAGDNYQGTEATKLGAENGIELHLPSLPVVTAPTPPAPQPTPVEPAPIVPVETTPVAPAEVAPAPVPKPVTKPAARPKHALPANPMIKSVVKAEIKTESAAKQKAAKAERERKLAAAAAARKQAMDYAAFEKANGGAAPKGRSGGVAAGTTLADGAGGTALTAALHDAMDAWKSLLIQRWKAEFVPPADFNQRMLAEVTFHVGANGVISAIHAKSSNGGPAFESAVTDALRHVTMPPPPNKKGDNYNVGFSLQDQEQ